MSCDDDGDDADNTNADDDDGALFQETLCANFPAFPLSAINLMLPINY